MVESNRLDWIDVAKGLGISSVVIGHVYTNYIHWIIFAFHMPLFFFLSGITLKPKQLKIKKIFKGLIIPYVSYLFLLSIIVIILNGIQLDIWYYISFIKSKMYGGVRLVKEFGVFWFPTVLFISLAYIKLIYVINNKNNISIEILNILFILCTSYILYEYINIYKLPFGFEIISISLPLIIFGYLYNNYLNLNTSIWIVFLFITSFYLLIFLYINGYKELDMKTLYIGENGINYFSSFIFILLIIYFSKIIDYLEIKFIKNMLIELGKSSITIMFLHQFFHFTFKENILDNKLFLVLISILIPYIIHLLFKRNQYTSLIFGAKNV